MFCLFCPFTPTLSHTIEIWATSLWQNWKKNYFTTVRLKSDLHTAIMLPKTLREKERKHREQGGDRRRSEGMRKREGGGLLPVAIPPCPHRQPGNLGGLQATWHYSPSAKEWCVPPLSLPLPTLQSFHMSSPTTKTEVGRLSGATAASGCLALKLPANKAGRRGGWEGGRERERCVLKRGS